MNGTGGKLSYFPQILSQLEKQLARVLPADCVLIMRLTSKTLDNGFEKEHKHGAVSTGRF